VHAVKTPTTPDVTGGIVAAIDRLGRHPAVAQRAIDAVVIGTTHFVNAVVTRRGLSPVAAIRIGLPTGASLPPFCDWPAELAALANGAVFMLEGGHDYDGREIMPFDEDGMRRAAREIAASDIAAAAVAAVFAPLDPRHEERARAILAEECPHVAVTLSHELGRIGLLERENAALLNAALSPLARTTIAGFRDAIAASRIAAPLYLTQNDGTVMSAETAMRLPVMSFASGATNSMRGAAFLSGLADAMVVDVGGTSTDVGQLRRGFPREANSVVEIGGVHTLFRMPDLFSIALGGGSRVTTLPLDGGGLGGGNAAAAAHAGSSMRPDHPLPIPPPSRGRGLVERTPAMGFEPSRVQVGPESVGYRLGEEALVFGGATPTATDAAVAAGVVDIGNPAKAAAMPPALAEAVLDSARQKIEDAIDRMKTEAGDVKLIAVGGGAFLVPERLLGVGEVIRVPHGDCANAVGAAIAQISGETDQVYREMTREAAIAAAETQARERAIAAGADPATLATVDVEDMPLAYLPGNALRVRVRVAGEMKSKDEL